MTWTSSNPDIATVDDKGMVTTYGGVGGRGRTGTATITAKTADGGFTATCVITITPVRVESVEIVPASLNMLVWGQSNLTANIIPASADNHVVTWTSLNTSIATVNSNGQVSALTGGAATIRVTTNDGSKTADITVNVDKLMAQKSGTLSLSSVGSRRVTLAGNFKSDSGQTIRYAITDNSDINQNPNSLNWQTNLTFSNLDDKTYYVFARAEESSTNLEGFWRVITLSATGWTTTVTLNTTKSATAATDSGMQFHMRLAGYSSPERVAAFDLTPNTVLGVETHRYIATGTQTKSLTKSVAPWAIEDISLWWNHNFGSTGQEYGLGYITLNFSQTGSPTISKTWTTFSDGTSNMNQNTANSDMRKYFSW